MPTASRTASTLTTKLHFFLQMLEPKERDAMLEILRHAAPDGTVQTRRQFQAATHTRTMITMPWDYMSYGAAVIGGAAGWVAGGSSFSSIPWNDIAHEARNAPLGGHAGGGE